MSAENEPLVNRAADLISEINVATVDRPIMVGTFAARAATETLQAAGFLREPVDRSQADDLIRRAALDVCSCRTDMPTGEQDHDPLRDHACLLVETTVVLLSHYGYLGDPGDPSAALRSARDDMQAVVSDGDVAEAAAPVEGEIGRATVVAARDALYDDPVRWLTNYIDREWGQR